jgi:sigma-B regulation protein RsbU (phosphoserine phosphatase)
VTEAEDPDSEEFEVERLAAAIAKSRHLSASQIVADVNKAVADFTRGAPQSDDITLIIARRVSQ